MQSVQASALLTFRRLSGTRLHVWLVQASLAPALVFPPPAGPCSRLPHTPAPLHQRNHPEFGANGAGGSVERPRVRSLCFPCWVSGMAACASALERSRANQSTQRPSVLRLPSWDRRGKEGGRRGRRRLKGEGTEAQLRSTPLSRNTWPEHKGSLEPAPFPPVALSSGFPAPTTRSQPVLFGTAANHQLPFQECPREAAFELRVSRWQSWMDSSSSPAICCAHDLP